MSGSPRTSIMLFLVALVLSMLSGCAPTITTQSNLAPDYRADLDKVFVILDSRQLDDTTRKVNFKKGEFKAEVSDTTSFANYFLEELALSFAAVNVEHEVYRITGLELSEGEFRGPAEEFGGDGELWVKAA